MESIRWAFNFCNWKPKQQDWALVLSLIQSEEKDRIKRFVFKKDAKASVIGRLMLRKYATATLGIPWKEVSYSRTEKGRPFLTNTVPEPFNCADVNVSHQGEWVVLAAELGPKVGIDVMKVEKAANKDTKEFFRLMNRQFTQHEWTMIKKYTEEDEQLSCFYRHWCLKESFVKSSGIGIGFDLQRISFNIQTDNLSNHLITTNTSVSVDGNLKKDWSFEETLLDNKHPVAVALDWSEALKDAQSEYCARNKTGFEVLNFDNLISDSEQVNPVNNELAAAMVAKEETPWT